MYFIQKAGKANLFAKRRQRLDFLDITMILATDLQLRQDDIAVNFLVFVKTFGTGFKRTEKKYVKVIDDMSIEKETFETFDCIR